MAWHTTRIVRLRKAGIIGNDGKIVTLCIAVPVAVALLAVGIALT